MHTSVILIRPRSGTGGLQPHRTSPRNYRIIFLIFTKPRLQTECVKLLSSLAKIRFYVNTENFRSEIVILNGVQVLKKSILLVLSYSRLLACVVRTPNKRSRLYMSKPHFHTRFFEFIKLFRRIVALNRQMPWRW